MAKRRFSFDLSPWLSQLRSLGGDTQKACRAAVYDGAQIMADAIREEINALKVSSDAEARAAYREERPTYISYSGRDGLRESLGVAPIGTGKDGSVNTRISFDGYNDVKTQKYPQGQPNALIAASCNHGSVGMLRQPFIDTAVKKARQEAETAMARAFESEIEKLQGGK